MLKQQMECEVAELPQRGAELQSLFDNCATGRQQKSGASSTVLRVQFHDTEAAVKRYPDDGRRRLEHEWLVLSQLPREVVPLAPRPLARSHASSPYDFAAYEWIEGEPISGDDSSSGILHYLRGLHEASAKVARERLARVPISLLNHNTVLTGPQAISAQFAILARHQHFRLTELRRLYERALRGAQLSGDVKHCVCHTDSNPLNFLAGSGRIVAVDWDAGGLGDPVFELAELSCHPAIQFKTDEEWVDTLQRNYVKPGADVDTGRFREYRWLMALWWCARISRQESEKQGGISSKERARIAQLLAYVQSSLA